MQLTDTDIESQCDDAIVELIQHDVVMFLKLLTRANSNISDTLEGSVTSLQKSPRRHFSTGQTDIGLVLQTGLSQTHILIENKVMSPFTDLQPERYQEEVDGLNKTQTTAALSVLIAPEKYLKTSSQAQKFDARLSYEILVTEMGHSESLFNGIERCASGWIAEEIPAVTDNFQGYVELTKKYDNLFVKTKPTNKPVQSRTIYFHEDRAGLKQPYLPKIRFNHQWQEGRTKVLFAGWGQFRNRLESVMENDLQNTNILVDPNKTKSLGLMIPTPVIDNHKSFDDQKAIMIAGLNTAETLRQFLVSNKSLTEKWAKSIYRNSSCR